MATMSETQVKTFERLSDVVKLAETTARVAVAVTAVLAEAMRADDETPIKWQSVLSYLEHDLDAAVESLGDAMQDLANGRRLCGLPPAPTTADTAHARGLEAKPIEEQR